MNRMLTIIGRLACLGLIALTTDAALANNTYVPNPHDVLVIDEAAQLLRMPPDKILALAAAQRIPARNIDGEWRFSRTALLEWLKGDRYIGVAPVPPGPTSGVKAAAAMPRTDLRSVTGTGALVSEQPERIAQAGAPAAASVGEKPTAKTAEEIALRDQGALLKSGATTLELGLAYSRSERQNLFPALRTDDTAFSVNLAARYGIGNDLQVTARLPGVHRRSTIQLVTSPTTVQEDKTSEQYFGDLSVSLLGVAVREAVGRPTVIWSVDSVLPTGPGDKGLGAGVILAKSYDPAVLFAGLSYLHGYSIEPGEARRQLATQNWRFTLGYTYALNDSIALNNVFVLSHRSDETPSGGVLRPSGDSQLLQLGMTWMLGRGLFVEPSVAFALGGAAPDFSFSLNFPYTF